jgi:hypothetical protein
MQLHYTHVGQDHLKEIAHVIDHDVRHALGVTNFARDGRRMDAIRVLKPGRLRR